MNRKIVIFWFIFVFVLTFIICLSVFVKSESFESKCVQPIPYTGYRHFPIKKDTIFVSVASYRDYECSATINSIFKKAKNPHNVFVGICEQNKENEAKELCLSDNYKYLNNIRIKKLDYTEARGPTYARYWCSQLWEGEEYYLQIDSHTTFVENWDIDLINMIKEAKKESNHPILSTYPPTKEQMNVKGFPEFDSAKINDNNIPLLYCGWSDESNEPKRSNKPWAAAGFMFLESDFLKSVPFDPNLSHLFQLEEILFSARLFTNGWDFYTPNKKICYHHYARKDAPMYHKDNPSTHSACRVSAEKRGLYILGVVPKNEVNSDFLLDINVYGLGNSRNIDDFWKASGIDIKNKMVERWNDSNKPSEKYKGWNFRLDGYKKINRV